MHYLSLTSILTPVSTARELLSISCWDPQKKGSNKRKLIHTDTHQTSDTSGPQLNTQTHLYPGSGRLHRSRSGRHFLLHQISQLPLLQLQTPRTQLLKERKTGQERRWVRFYPRRDSFIFFIPSYVHGVQLLVWMKRGPLRWPGWPPEPPSACRCPPRTCCSAASSGPAAPELQSRTPSRCPTALRGTRGGTQRGDVMSLQYANNARSCSSEKWMTLTVLSLHNIQVHMEYKTAENNNQPRWDCLLKQRWWPHW